MVHLTALYVEATCLSMLGSLPTLTLLASSSSNHKCDVEGRACQYKGFVRAVTHMTRLYTAQAIRRKYTTDLATKRDAERVGMLRHDELSHVCQGEVRSD